MSEQPVKNRIPIDIEPVINEEPILEDPLADEDQENADNENEIYAAMVNTKVLALKQETEIIELESGESSDQYGDDCIESKRRKYNSDNSEERETDSGSDKEEDDNEEKKDDKDCEDPNDSEKKKKKEVPNAKYLQENLDLLTDTITETAEATEKLKSGHMEPQVEMDLNQLAMGNIVKWIKRKLKGEDPSGTPLKFLLDRIKETMLVYYKVKEGGRRRKTVMRIEGLFQHVYDL